MHHGTQSRCGRDACREVNAPMDCEGCGRVVASDSLGVLDFDGTYMPYKLHVTHGL